jgi:hypothetical protein
MEAWADHPRVAAWQRRALVAGVVGAVACAVGAFLSPAQFFRSYLVAYLYWMGVALGCLGVGLLHNMTGGAWGRVIRAFLEAGMRTLPLVALFFVPVALGARHLYEWTHADVVAADELLQSKSAYLNLPAMLVRAVVYFALWIGFAAFSTRFAERAQSPSSAGAAATRRLKLSSAPGILIYVLTMTFASIDWAMSLDPHWFSTIYGVIFIVGQALSAFALAIVLLAALRDDEPLAGVVTQDHFHDLGNLLFAFVLLWAYVSLSQLLIIWSANLPEEIPWYLRRFYGGWQYVGFALVAFHFILPFFILLSRLAKRRSVILARVAIAILVMRYVDLYWMVAPEMYAVESEGTMLGARSQFHFHWLDVAAFAAIGGLWLALYMRGLRARPLLAAHEPTEEPVDAPHAIPASAGGSSHA